MALGDNYADLAELKDYIKLTSSTKDLALEDALSSASREIERYCNRQFNQADVATARIFKPTTQRVVSVDDIASTAGMVVQIDPGGSGGFTDTLSASDYELTPFNGVVDGQPGWPYIKIRTVGRWFPDTRYTWRKGVVQVTAVWGWSAVPAPIKQACLIMAAQMYKIADAPLGVAGYGQSSEIRVRNFPQVVEKLTRYRRDAIAVG